MQLLIYHLDEEGYCDCEQRLSVWDNSRYLFLAYGVVRVKPGRGMTIGDLPRGLLTVV